MQVVFAEYMQMPPASAHAGPVSLEGGAQYAAWHVPPRQTAPLSQGQPHAGPVGALASARWKAVVYVAAALLLTAAVVQLSQASAGHEATSPTATQSLSTAQDWS